MAQLLAECRDRDTIIGYTSRGVHRDDIELLLGQHSMRKTGSQGQCKTYTIALRLAQYDFLKRVSGITPILLLDDIFDKLDASRVENIISMVSNSDNFGQIFITDTNRTHLDEIVKYVGSDYRIFMVNSGVVQSLPNEDKEDGL
jgi:DNA replication and repair protein RecF